MEHHIGFSGSREGMTEDQEDILDFLLVFGDYKDRDLVGHHGDCVGSDEIFHYVIANNYSASIVIHPPISEYKRAFLKSDEIRKPKDYLERDRDIVDESDTMFFTPNGFLPRVRSGTWYTAKYAHKIHKPGIIIFPDGETNTLSRFFDG